MPCCAAGPIILHDWLIGQETEIFSPNAVNALCSLYYALKRNHFLQIISIRFWIPPKTFTQSGHAKLILESDPLPGSHSFRQSSFCIAPEFSLYLDYINICQIPISKLEYTKIAYHFKTLSTLIIICLDVFLYKNTLQIMKLFILKFSIRPERKKVLCRILTAGQQTYSKYWRREERRLIFKVNNNIKKLLLTNNTCYLFDR